MLFILVSAVLGKGKSGCSRGGLLLPQHCSLCFSCLGIPLVLWLRLTSRPGHLRQRTTFSLATTQIQTLPPLK
jgi:hypothetical protein